MTITPEIDNGFRVGIERSWCIRSYSTIKILYIPYSLSIQRHFEMLHFQLGNLHILLVIKCFDSSLTPFPLLPNFQKSCFVPDCRIKSFSSHFRRRLKLAFTSRLKLAAQTAANRSLQPIKTESTPL